MQGIIFAGGRGRRMLPITSYISKPMLPVLRDGTLKPAVQVVFETLFDMGARDFIIFARDAEIRKYMRYNQRVINEMADSDAKAMHSMLRFYTMLRSSKVRFVSSIGSSTGNTLLISKNLVADDFVIAASDVILDVVPALPRNSVLASATKAKGIYTTIEVHKGTVSKLHFRHEKSTGVALLPYMRLDHDFINALESIDSTKNLGLHMGLGELIRHKPVKVVMTKGFHDIGSLSGYAGSFMHR